MPVNTGKMMSVKMAEQGPQKILSIKRNKNSSRNDQNLLHQNSGN